MPSNWRDTLRYYFDTLMGRGTGAMIAALLSVTVLLVAAVALILLVAGVTPDQSFGALVWQGFMHTIDTGTITADDGNDWYVGAMLLITIAGLFFYGALISILNTWMLDRVALLQRGRSRVIERHHVVVLGWSAQIHAILDELIRAESEHASSCVVVLAKQDKTLMEEAIRERLREAKLAGRRHGRVRIVCRTGDPVDSRDVAMVNPQLAKAIIVLPTGGPQSDAAALKTVLAITRDVPPNSQALRIVVQVEDPANAELVRIAAGGHATIVRAGQFIARTIVQSSRHAGLSAVWTELLSFDGNEIYFTPAGRLAGQTYGDALQALEQGTVIGIVKPDRVRVNPPTETSIETGDQLVVVAPDHATAAVLALERTVDESAILPAPELTTKPERFLLLGWSERAAIVVRELDGYVAAASSVTVIAAADATASVERVAESVRHLQVERLERDLTRPDFLAGLEVHSYDHIIVMACAERFADQEADAVTLAVLLRLRSALGEGARHGTVVSEMLDVRNRDLARQADVDDFIVSEQFVSLLMTQLAENPGLQAVLDELLTAAGCELYIRPIGQYVKPGEVGWPTVIEAARRRGETAIGYRVRVEGEPGIHLNPPKSARVVFGARDGLIVVAE